MLRAQRRLRRRRLEEQPREMVALGTLYRRRTVHPSSHVRPRLPTVRRSSLQPGRRDLSESRMKKTQEVMACATERILKNTTNPFLGSHLLLIVFRTVCG